MAWGASTFHASYVLALLLPFTLLHNFIYHSLSFLPSFPLICSPYPNTHTHRSFIFLSLCLSVSLNPSIYRSMAVQAQYPSNILLLNRFISILYPLFSLCISFQAFTYPPFSLFCSVFPLILQKRARGS